MISVLLIVFCFIILIFSPASGLAIWMTKEECKKPLRVGELIMGSEAIFSTLREIRVYRNGDLLESGSTYVPGEELLVVLHGTDDNGLQFVYEATNAVFIGGGCDGHRLANSKAAKILMPSDLSTDALNVQIIAGWSGGYETVKITPVFNLHSKTAMSEMTGTDATNNQPTAPLQTAPNKTNLRKQPVEITSQKLADLDANVQTLPADHKVKIKHSSPGAYARTHPKLLSKIPIGSVEAASVASALDAEINKVKGTPVDTKPPTTPSETLKVQSVLPPVTPPTDIKSLIKGPSLLADMGAGKEKGDKDAPTLKDVMDTMKEVSDEVHDRSRHARENAHTLHAPLKSPSKRSFLDSFHVNKPRHAERKPVNIEPRDRDAKEDTALPEKNSEQERKGSEKEGNQVTAKKDDSVEDLPGADLSATEKRLRRSQLADSLLSGRGEFRAKSVMREEGPSDVSGRSASVTLGAPIKTIFGMLFAGTIVFVGAMLFVSVLMYFAGYKDDLSRVFMKLTRRKDGQDKE